MKLTKKIEQEVLKVYNTGWDAYMKGDLTTHSTCLSSKFKIIGTTEGENFNNKQAWLAFCKKTIHQVVGVAQMRNRKIKLDAVGDGVMVVENSNIYVLIEGKWKFYSKIRITALMQKEKTGWKYVHQHGSLPDMRASEDETIATKQIKKENQQLREAVKRRTIELEEKNRELEIESSLEKVRAQALGMRKSEDLLDICRTLYIELAALGFNTLRNAVIHVFHDERACFTDHEYSDSTGGNITTVPYKGDVIVERFINRIRKSENAFVEQKVEGKELSNFKSFRKKTGQIKDNRLKQTKAIHYYIYSVGHASIGISSFSAIEKDKKELLKRFRNVFDFAYRRYTDITLVQAQAREAQIEAALERVRSRSLAMYKSDELREVLQLIFEQLWQLNFNIDSAQFGLNYKESDDLNVWTAVPGQPYPTLQHIPYFSNPVMDSAKQAKEMGLTFFSHIATREEKNKFFNHFFSHIKTVPQDRQKYILDRPGFARSVVFLDTVFLGIQNYSGTPYTDTENAVLRRFGKVFEQSYTRFLDLQKAEVQAREAQIEAALERVRSRSMAMHNSADLSTVVFDMFTELVNLDAQLDRCLILIVNPHTLGITWYLTGKEGLLSDNGFLVQDNDHPSHKAYLEGWRTRRKKWKYLLAGKEKKNWDTFGFSQTGLAQLPEFIKADMANVEAIHLTISSDSFGCLIASSLSPLADEHAAIVERFTLVFNQTYTRFLDLQKAEAQAREAQIEAALERVRAKAMALKKSGELKELIVIILKEFKKLGFGLYECNLLLFDTKPRDLIHWGSGINDSEPNCVKVPYFDHPFLTDLFADLNKGVKFRAGKLSGKALKSFLRHLLTQTQFKDASQEYKDGMMSIDSLFFTHSVITHGFLEIVGSEALSEEKINVLKRFTRVVDMAYTRFDDVVKAEAQAREAQIEAALERVRAQTMAMHNSEDVGKCVVKMFSELTALGVDEGTRFGIGILNHDNENNQLWTVRKDGEEVSMHIGNLDMTLHPLLKSARKAWKEQAPLHQYVLEGEDLINYYQMINTAPDYRLHIAIETLPDREYHYGFIFNHGFFYAFSPREFQPELIQITQRFSSVFAQTYQRYLDLQKAEAQAREAQIEAALERVRARAMAMHTSRELEEVAHELRTQIGLLGGNEQLETCAINLYEESDEHVLAWGATRPPNSKSEIVNYSFYVPKVGIALIEEMLRAYTANQEEYLLRLDGHGMVQWLNVLKQVKPDLFSIVDKAVDFSSTGQHTAWFSCAFFHGGTLVMITFSEPDNQSRILLRRFAQVFGLAYRRFADLKQAEAQAREAQIEAALERIRSRSMAMHKSDELLNVITVVSEQLQYLGLKFNTVSFAVNNREHDYKFWFVAMGDTNPTFIKVPYISNPMYDRLKDVLARGVDFYSDTLTPEESRRWHEHVFAHASLPYLTEETKAYILRSGYARSIAIKPSIMLIVSNYAGKPYSDNENEILKRFATVFEQSYTRFLDIQKAEAQAREAQIEAALERVRSKAMAMHSSEDLSATIYAFYHELELFSITPRRCGVGLLDKETRMAELSTMNTTEQGQSIEVIGKLKMIGHPVLEGVYVNWLAQEEYHPVLRGNEIKEYYQIIRPQVAFPEYPNDAVQYGYFFFFAEGGVYAWTEKELLEDELKIYRRFTTVLSLAYKRYKDLKDAEAREQEAIKQSALDRVRADIASMRSTTDLERITPLIWSELTTLGVPFIRSGVFIMDEHGNKVHSYLSTPDGRAIAAFHTPMDDSGSLAGAIEHWRQQKIFVTHWVESDFQKQAEVLLKHGSITTHEQYLNTLPKEGFHLHFLPFRQGMLYVGSLESLPSDVLQLVQSLADAFSVAYARYEDFTKLELAKAQIENTLSDLKQTQTQLIQSEKMASLGELTAGIAHEIQNPLNFVNNFSEVSTELVKEMVDELEKGNLDEVKVIANDVVQNLEKINHHGKRAADIVKGMLQHSRSSSGQKELTDINALADEYLRLAYHGLRAKDKSFNATMKTDFDESIGKINVVPQDIGRVVLNLITNAFYAVTERKKQEGDNFEPTVSVITKKTGDKVLISVKDNGNGIPDSIKEKIFQPFFTTKPTGQGTGLGLSLSYDIVKAHGGELKVETSDGEGSTFTIQIPMALQ